MNKHLYLGISTAFCLLIVLSNIISVKLVRLPYFEEFCIPAGLLFYPLTYLLSNLATEMFGSKEARQMVYMALGMNLLSFGIIQLALLLPATIEQEQTAFNAVLGLSGLRIFSSLTATLVAQIADIHLYSFIKRWTGSSYLLRNNGAACTSLLLDTIIVDLLYFYWGLGMGLHEVMPILCISYAYKVLFSVANTPLYYLMLFAIKRKPQTSA